MKKLILLTIVLFGSNLLTAQKGSSPALGAKALSMGGTGVCSDEIDAILYNQAGLAGLESLSFVAASERKFNLTQLTAVSLGLAIPVQKIGTFGILVSNYGDDIYSEQKVGVSYARLLAKHTSIGAQIDFFNTRIDQFGNAGLFTFELGMKTRLVEGLNLGFHIFSPAQIKLTDEENLLTRARLGLKYTPSDKVELQAEVDQYIDFETIFRFGLAYNLSEVFSVRAGYFVGQFAGAYSVGLGYDWKDLIKIEIGYAIHEILGGTPGISIIYNRAPLISE